MGRIQDAQAEVERIEAEIGDMRRQLQELRMEHARLQKSFNPDDVARSEALRAAIRRLEAELPIPHAQPGEVMPAIQHRLNQAEERLERMRRERYNLCQQVGELEELGTRWARLGEVREALELLQGVFTEARAYPPRQDDVTWRAMIVWARNQQARIASLPNWRARLEEYGGDPGYRPPRAPEGERWPVGRRR